MNAPGLEGRGIVNALTIDVEDYFHVAALSPHIPRAQWDALPCRVERNVEIILSLLDDAGAHATFFTLGWVAERYPGLVRGIVSQGHEIASHGYGHNRVTDQSPEAFLADIRLAKSVLEGISGEQVKGYRAPNFSVNDRNPWAFDCIAEAGYRYSSSVYPVRHDHYGMPRGPRFAYLSRDGLLELPVTTHRLFRTNVPAGGGGYFRLMPYSVSRWLIRRVNQIDEQAAIFYFHPWEIDPEQPRITGLSMKTQFRHYVNLERTQDKLRRLLSDFTWDRLDRVFLEQL